MVAVELRAEDATRIDLGAKLLRLPNLNLPQVNLLDMFLPKIDYEILSKQREIKGEPHKPSLFYRTGTDYLDDYMGRLSKHFWTDIESRFKGRWGSLRFKYLKFIQERLG